MLRDKTTDGWTYDDKGIGNEQVSGQTESRDEWTDRDNKERLNRQRHPIQSEKSSDVHINKER